MTQTFAKFSIGQIIHNHLFDYRGVIVDVDPSFQGSEDWYNTVARSRPPKGDPWYHVLVDGADQRTYVAEKNLKLDTSGLPINNPEVFQHFSTQTTEGYLLRSKVN